MTEIRDQLTPPEAAVLESESPLRVTRMVDMFLSRNDFDPRRYDDMYRAEHERLDAKQANVERVSRQAAHARDHAMQVIQRTNDLSDTLRRIRQ